MGASIANGPVISTGNLDPTVIRDPDLGPDLSYQGSGIIDPRYVSNIGSAPGYKINALYCSPYMPLVDAVPAAAGTATIAALANVTSGTAMTLASATAAGISPNIQVETSPGTFTKCVALDFGFTTGTTVAQATNNVTSIPAGAMKFFKVGKKLVISSGASASLPLYCTVTAVDVANTQITVSPAPTNAAASLQIGSADLSDDAAWPYVVAGIDAFLDPTQALCRAVSITGVTSGTGGAFIVRGYDIYGNAMAETITCGAGVNTVNGKKAFKYISSVTPQFTDAHNYSVGTADIYGINVRADFWEYMNVFWAGAFITVSTGWTAALAAGTASTATTADTRGTYAVQSAANGTNRLAIFMSLPSYNALNATNLDSSTLFGATQYTV